jgi:hypothetical protein
MVTTPAPTRGAAPFLPKGAAKVHILLIPLSLIVRNKCNYKKRETLFEAPFGRKGDARRAGGWEIFYDFKRD